MVAVADASGVHVCELPIKLEVAPLDTNASRRNHTIRDWDHSFQSVLRVLHGELGSVFVGMGFKSYMLAATVPLWLQAVYRWASVSFELVILLWPSVLVL